MLISAAGEKNEDFRAEMANFMSKWGTLVVYGKNQSCQKIRAEHETVIGLHPSSWEGTWPTPGVLIAPSGGVRAWGV